MTWSAIAAPVCIGLTAGGLIVSWLRWRRKGAQRGLRAVAWSLLPLAAYLTGAAPLLGKIGSAVASFATGFAFSPETWAGLILLGGGVLLFVGTGGLPMLRRRKPRGEGKKAAGSGPARPAAASPAGSAQLPAAAGKGKRVATTKPDDDDFGEVAEILRRRGIS